MRDCFSDYQARSNEATLKKIAVGVRVYLSHEHDEHYEGEVIERVVSEWMAREVENLLADGVELLTEARYGHSYRLRQRLDELNNCGRGDTGQASLRQAA